MRKGEIEKRIRDIEAQLKTLPVGSVVNKNIKGKPQPYLQWSEDGHTKSQYLKRADRDEMMDKVVLRKNLSAELKTLKAELAKLPDEIEMPEYRCHVIQGENLQKISTLLFIGQFAEEKQVGEYLIAEPVFPEHFDQPLHRIASIPEFAVDGDSFSVFFFK